MPNGAAVWLGRRDETADSLGTGGRIVGSVGLLMLSALSGVVASEAYETTSVLAWSVFAGVCALAAAWGMTRSRSTMLAEIAAPWFARVDSIVEALRARSVPIDSVELESDPLSSEAAIVMLLDESAEFAIFAGAPDRNRWLRDRRRPGGGLVVGMNWAASTDAFDGALQVARALDAKAIRRA